MNEQDSPELAEAIAIYRAASAEYTEKMVRIIRRCWGNPEALAREMKAAMLEASALAPKGTVQ